MQNYDIEKYGRSARLAYAEMDYSAYRQARRMRLAEMRRRERNRVITVILVTIVLTFLATCIGLHLSEHAAEADGMAFASVTKCYKSVAVREGDSIWSIADREMGAGWKDARAYVDEVEEINGLGCDTIQAGTYLTVPYYVSA